MLLRLPNVPARIAAILLALALAATLAYSSIRNARATHDAGLGTRIGYEAATRLEPQNADNWYLLARYWQYTLDEPNNPRAIQNYRHALLLNPANADIWLDLAAAYEAEGDIQKARDAFLQAKRAYPLSAAVSWRYGNFLLRQDELPQAFAEIRRAAYADPKLSGEAFSRCWRVSPDINTILDTVLPPDRDGYLDVIRELGTQAQLGAALIVWQRLVSIHPVLKLSEAILFSELLIHNHQIHDARRVWSDAIRLSNTPQNIDAPGSALWDGGFETGLRGGAFAWVFAAPSGGVQIGVDSRQKHSGNYSLRLTFDGRHNVNFQGVCNNAEVQPETNYRLSAWLRTQALTTDEGVRLLLSSYSDSHAASSVVTPSVQGTQPWTSLEIPWTSPKDVHHARVCVVRYPSSKLDSQIQGSAWIDDIALVPEAGSSRP
jgi:Carbohydrate binding domain/Tetratricopeptide repeat